MKVLIAGLAIIIFTNAFALLGVAYNRSGDPESQVELTERELRIIHQDQQSSFRLCPRVENTHHSYYDIHYCIFHNETPNWLDAKKLLELGFDRAAKKVLIRKLYLVLEYDGAAYQRLLTQAEKAHQNAVEELADYPDRDALRKRVQKTQEMLERERNQYSRLVAIDIGTDKHSLRQRYPDSTQYIFVPALVLVPPAKTHVYADPWTGMVTRLLNRDINIPRQYRNQLDGHQQYKVKIAFGQRSEPWIVAVDE